MQSWSKGIVDIIFTLDQGSIFNLLHQNAQDLFLRIHIDGLRKRAFRLNFSSKLIKYRIKRKPDNIFKADEKIQYRQRVKRCHSQEIKLFKDLIGHDDFCDGNVKAFNLSFDGTQRNFA